MIFKMFEQNELKLSKSSLQTDLHSIFIVVHFEACLQIYSLTLFLLKNLKIFHQMLTLNFVSHKKTSGEKLRNEKGKKNFHKFV